MWRESRLGKDSGNRAGLINHIEHRCGSKNQAVQNPGKQEGRLNA